MRSRRWVVGAVAGLAFVAAAVLGFAASAVATTVYPPADGRCVDQVGVLGRDLCAKVTAVLTRDEKTTSDEIAVAVVPTTGEATIEEFSTGLFNAWGVGKKAKNNGVLLVVAVDDRTLRLETGRGMADRLSDDDARDIVDTVITPRFASDEYAAGILAGLDEIRRTIGHHVPTGARLENLTGQAPDAAGQETSTAAGDGSITGEGGADGISDGSWSADGDQLADGGFSHDLDDGDGALLVWLFAFGGFAVLGLVALVTRLASSQSAGLGSGSSPDWQPGRRSDLTSVRHSMWTTTGTDWSSNSSSSSGSSGASDSSFGGGSSGGGGASGSW